MKKYCLIYAIVAVSVISHLPNSLSAPIPHNNFFSFYGKVTDQNDQPLAGAHVKIGVASDLPEDNYEEKVKDYTLETDQNGTFVLKDALGFGIQISITKAGYELSQKAPRGFSFLTSSELKHPDENKPTLFKMWQSTGKEPLVHSSWHGKVACDGTTNRFDLASGHSIKDGNLEIVCIRDPINLPPANTKPFTWKFQIKIIGGSIQPANEEFTYLAPKDSYKPNLSYGQTGDDPKWDRNKPMPKEYYIKTSDGHYGEISVNWDRSHAQSPTILEWNCSINPSGSRDLER